MIYYGVRGKTKKPLPLTMTRRLNRQLCIDDASFSKMSFVCRRMNRKENKNGGYQIRYLNKIDNSHSGYIRWLTLGSWCVCERAREFHMQSVNITYHMVAAQSSERMPISHCLIFLSHYTFENLSNWRCSPLYLSSYVALYCHVMMMINFSACEYY